MAWYVIAAEAVIVIALAIRLIIKFRAMRGIDEEEAAAEGSSPSAPSGPDVPLPDEERWE